MTAATELARLRKELARMTKIADDCRADASRMGERALRAEAALRPIAEAAREAHGDVLPRKYRDGVNPDYHLDITITASEAWEIVDILEAADVIE